VRALEARVKELEAENARLNDDLTIKTGEIDGLRRSKKKSSKKVKELEGRIVSFEEDIKNYGAPSQLCKERDDSKVALEGLRKEFGELLARSVKG
ncbi:hypothetical protein A2U01_0076194, partial [Trifolium medium]|nr:hypothetical protein [Trifolium medium]